MLYNINYLIIHTFFVSYKCLRNTTKYFNLQSPLNIDYDMSKINKVYIQQPSSLPGAFPRTSIQMAISPIVVLRIYRITPITVQERVPCQILISR